MLNVVLYDNPGNCKLDNGKLLSMIIHKEIQGIFLWQRVVSIWVVHFKKVFRNVGRNHITNVVLNLGSSKLSNWVWYAGKSFIKNVQSPLQVILFTRVKTKLVKFKSAVGWYHKTLCESLVSTNSEGRGQLLIMNHYQSILLLYQLGTVMEWTFNILISLNDSILGT